MSEFTGFMLAFVPLLVLVALYLCWLESEALAAWLLPRLQSRVVMRRNPDLVVGDHHDPYLLRWFLIPRNPVCNLYLHCFLRSDDDRALHDHPWISLSLMLHGTAVEHTIEAGGVHCRRTIEAGDWRWRTARFAHRIELPTTFRRQGSGVFRDQGACWTLFLTGPVVRAWGFHCPKAGWVSHYRFTAADDRGQIGKGCDA